MESKQKNKREYSYEQDDDNDNDDDDDNAIPTQITPQRLLWNTNKKETIKRHA